MKIQFLTALAAGFLLAADAPKGDVAQKDQEKLQGTWTVVAAEHEGQPLDRIKNDTRADDPALRGLFRADDMKQNTDHGAVGYPELASAEKGKAFLSAAIERTVEVAQALLRRQMPK